MKWLFLLLSVSLFADVHINAIPRRLEWVGNSGYSGEASLISAGLFYGQYTSQYDARLLVSSDQTSNRVLLGSNIDTAASKLHLKYELWNGGSTHAFLSWVKSHVVAGHPVIIGVYANQYLFYDNPNPNAGNANFDHMVCVENIGSSHSLNDPTYYPDDTIGFSDHGFWHHDTPIYYFNYSFDDFQCSRVGANAPVGAVYGLANGGNNYGIAITGVADALSETTALTITASLLSELPEIVDGSSTRPTARPVVLTLSAPTMEALMPYMLYQYNNLSSIPNTNINGNGKNAYRKWTTQISPGAVFQQIIQIQSSDVAAFRFLKYGLPQ